MAAKKTNIPTVKLLTGDALNHPPETSDWKPIAFGFSLTQARLLTWVSVFAFIALQALLFVIFKEHMFDDFILIKNTLGSPLFIVTSLSVILIYVILHEATHFAYFKHHDKRTNQRAAHLAILASSPCVIYNGSITPKDKIKGCIAPLVIFTPLLILPIVFYPGWLSSNFLFLHLFTCAGDILLSVKLAGLKDTKALWSMGTSCFGKR